MSEEDELPEVFSRAQARSAGLTDRQIDRRLASGRFESLGRGIARQQPSEQTPAGQTPAEPEASQVKATSPPIVVPPSIAAALLATANRHVVISHASAARILGLPKPLAGWGVPQFTATSGPTRKRSGTHILVAGLTDRDVVEVKNLLITRPARTVLDCLRTLPPPDGLAILDAALHQEQVTFEQLLDMLEQQSGWPGVARAREVLALGDGRRESPLESWSAWCFYRHGVSPVQWQMEVRDQDGRFVARTDCWWEGVAGEADGRSKYVLAAAQQGGANAQSLYSVLANERRRERLLRDTGADVVRWSTADVRQDDRGRALAVRISEACDLARRMDRFTGLVAPVTLPLVSLGRPSSSRGR